MEAVSNFQVWVEVLASSSVEAQQLVMTLQKIVMNAAIGRTLIYDVCVFLFSKNIRIFLDLQHHFLPEDDLG